MPKTNKERYENLLDVYTLQDILELNDMEEWEVLEILVDERYLLELPEEPI